MKIKTIFLFTVLIMLTYFNPKVWSQNYKIVDTGQDICYDSLQAITPPQQGQPFYGQDAQIDGNQPSYTISSDSLTVHDNVTGLTWVKKPDTNGDGVLNSYDKLTWPEFQAYVDTLNAENFGGYNDWRMPTIKDLYSLIDFRGRDVNPNGGSGSTPFIDTLYFDFVYGDTSVGERIIDAQYWSSTQYLGTTMNGNATIFGVNFADGRIKGYPRDIGPGGVATHYARYVRGNVNYGINDFTDNGDGTITDNATGLMWTKDDFGNGSSTGPRSGMTWEDALAFAQQKNSENYLGHNDWRLPNAKEMQSILDYSRSPDSTGSGAIDPVFNITQITNEDDQVDYPWFWTGTTHLRFDNNAEAGVYICFGRAVGYWQSAWTDVHGAGAQRTDRKYGDFTGDVFEPPNGYYFPMAPQGDAVRIYNYVRLVRDVSPAGVHESGTESPTKFKLGQNYPNPFNPTTKIGFQIANSGFVTLKIYDVLGREVSVLVNENKSPGSYSVDFNASKLPSGVYFYRLEEGNLIQTKKMVLTK